MTIANTDQRLTSIVSRIERLEEEKRDLAADIRDIYKEAASAGYDKKVLRTLIAERKKDAAEIEEQRTLLETYKAALGDFVSTDLGRAAVEKVGA